MKGMSAGTDSRVGKNIARATDTRRGQNLQRYLPRNDMRDVDPVYVLACKRFLYHIWGPAAGVNVADGLLRFWEARECEC